MSKHLIKATVYDRAGKVLSTAFNNYTKSHPIQARFATKLGQPDRIYLHAELAALVALRKHHAPFKIKVERHTKDGQPANAKPCLVCQAAIKHWNINIVEHT